MVPVKIILKKWKCSSIDNNKVLSLHETVSFASYGMYKYANRCYLGVQCIKTHTNCLCSLRLNVECEKIYIPVACNLIGEDMIPLACKLSRRK